MQDCSRITQSAMVVEFVGFPGSGKSTIICSTTQALRDAGTFSRVFSLDGAALPLGSVRRALIAFGAMFGQPALITPTLRLLRCVPPRDLRTCLPICGMIFVRVRAIARARRRGGIVLVDHGVAQSVWSLWLRTHSLKARRALVLVLESALPDAPLCLIHVDVPSEVAVDRLDGRAERNLSLPRAGAALTEALARTADYFDELQAGEHWFQRCSGDGEHAHEVIALTSFLASLARSAN